MLVVTGLPGIVGGMGGAGAVGYYSPGSVLIKI